VPEPDLFTHDGLRLLLSTALDQGYSFESFPRARTAIGRVCILRHDVDLDLGAATRVAEIERDLGISATFFLMLRSPLYNLLSRENHRLASSLLDLGHEIGLHYDGAFAPDDSVEMEHWIATERDILQRMFGRSIDVVSFHQPGLDVLEGAPTLAGMINAYSLRDSFFYISDSNMVFRSGSPLTFFQEKAGDHLQLLLHPIWWDSDTPGRSTMDMFDHAISENWLRAQRQLIATEGAFGPERILEITRP